VVSGTLEKKEKFGYFVNLEPGITGLLPLSRVRRAPEPAALENLAPGDALAVVIEEIDTAERKITLNVARESEAADWKSFTPGKRGMGLGSLGEKLREAMDEKELERRRKELRKLYHPPLLSRIARRVYNALAYVKDKIASSLSLSSRIPTSMIPGAREIIAEAEKKALAPLGATYDPLLENGIGRLVTLRVKDVDGSERRYQGVLREYSAKYIAVYDVDYRIGMVCCFRGSEKLPGYPKPKLAGLDRGVRGGELRARLDRGAVVIENLDERPVRIEKVSSGDAVVEVGKILEPGASLRVGIPEGFGEEYCVEYEVCREADVVWPRSKAVVVGLGDYPPRILELLVS